MHEWSFKKFQDGTEQWSPSGWGDWPPSVFIERVHSVKSRRGVWHIVRRQGRTAQNRAPPIVSGPFEDIDAAMVSYILLHAAGRLTR